MKLSRIPGVEPTVKQVFSFRQSTVDQLAEYQAACSEISGGQVPLRDLVEQILLDFMAEDKAFQRMRKDKTPRKAKASNTQSSTSTPAATDSSTANPSFAPRTAATLGAALGTSATSPSA